MLIKSLIAIIKNPNLIENLEKEIKKRDNEIKKLKDSNVVNNELKNLKIQYSKLLEENNILKTKKISTEKLFSENQVSLEIEKAVNENKKQFTNKIIELETKINNFSEEKENLKREYENKLQQLEKKVLEFEKIENNLKKFKLIVQKMEKCSSLKNINEKIYSNNENEKLLNFISIFGNGEDFLRDLYKEFKDSNTFEKIALKIEDLEFIQEINNYFKNNKNYEENVIIIAQPEIDKFDKSIMQDITKPSDFSFKIIEEIFVPGVKTKQYNFKAIVKGRK